MEPRVFSSPQLCKSLRRLKAFDTSSEREEVFVSASYGDINYRASLFNNLSNTSFFTHDDNYRKYISRRVAFKILMVYSFCETQ